MKIKQAIIRLLGDNLSNKLKNIYDFIRCFFYSELILIYQMGKVGSQSVYYSLIERKFFPIFFFHEVALLKDQKRLQYFYLMVALRKKKPIKIITLVRDPIGRTVSSFAHDFWGYFGSKMTDHPFQELVEKFWQYDRHDYGLEWFENEFQRLTGIDVYQYDFDKERGYQVIRVDNFQVLMMKSELSDPEKQDAVAKFLELPEFELNRSNVASDKDYREMYKKLKKELVFPEAYLEKNYSSKYCRHFYTEEEISGFISYWEHKRSE